MRSTRWRLFALACLFALAACGVGTRSATSPSRSPAGSSDPVPSTSSSPPTYSGPVSTFTPAEAPPRFPGPPGLIIDQTYYALPGVFSQSGSPTPVSGWGQLYINAEDQMGAQQSRDFYVATLSAIGWTVKGLPVYTGTYQGYATHWTQLWAKAPAGSGFDYAMIRIFRSEDPQVLTSIQIHFSRNGMCANHQATVEESDICPAGYVTF